MYCVKPLKLKILYEIYGENQYGTRIITLFNTMCKTILHIPVFHVFPLNINPSLMVAVFNHFIFFYTRNKLKLPQAEMYP